VARLGDKFARSGRQDFFRRLTPFLMGDEPDYAALAKELDTSPGSLRVAVHRLRRQFATTLREAVAETVEGPDEIDGELRHLLSVVSS
jgi:RNA polymerase sigma-70 factor (ECF subfamily)